MSTSKNVVILGASFSGLPMAHYLVKHLPADYTVTLVNPSTHFFWNIASPRAVVAPELLGKNHTDLFLPLLPAFEKYAAGRFTFVQGKAISSSPATNTVTVRKSSDNTKGGDELVLSYEHLIIATGSREASGEWGFKPTGNGTHVDTQASIAATRSTIEAAETIVISGAGTTGVELVGEIASHFGGKGKHITLVSSSAQPLPAVPEAVGKAARYHLEDMGVTIRDNAKVTQETKNPTGTGSQLVLSTGETIAADIHISTWGMTPNTEFLPKELLDKAGWVTTDKYMRTPTHDNIWAIGDVTHWGNRQLTPIETMHNAVAANLLARVGGGSEAEFTEYKHKSDVLMIVPMGAKFGRATAYLFGMRIWGWLAWLVKGKTYLIESSRPIAEGKATSGRTKI